MRRMRTGGERKRDSHRLDDVPVALPRLAAARTGPAWLRAVALDLPPLALCAVGRGRRGRVRSEVMSIWSGEEVECS